MFVPDENNSISALFVEPLGAFANAIGLRGCFVGGWWVSEINVEKFLTKPKLFNGMMYWRFFGVDAFRTRVAVRLWCSGLDLLRLKFSSKWSWLATSPPNNIIAFVGGRNTFSVGRMQSYSTYITRNAITSATCSPFDTFGYELTCFMSTPTIPVGDWRSSDEIKFSLMGKLIAYRSNRL